MAVGPFLVLLTAVMILSRAAAQEMQPRNDQEQVISLNEAIEIALKNNPSIAIAREQIARSRSQVREAAAKGLPQVSASAVHSRTREVTAPLGGQRIEIVPGSSTILTGNLTQAADVFGLVGLGVSAARLQRNIQELNLSAAERSVILEVKNAYYNVLRAMAQRDVAQAGVAVAEERLRLARAGLEAGTLAKFDVTTAEVQVANLRQVLIAATNAIDTARAVLANVMGIDVTRPFEVERVVPEAKAPDLQVAKAIEIAYRQRPEVLAAQTAVELQKITLRARRKEHLPLFGLFATVERNLNPGAFGLRDTWRYGVNATWSIWDGGGIEARIRQAEADLRAAEDRLQQAKLGVGLEVQSAAVAVKDAYERVSTAEANVRLAEEALRLAQVRYQAGISVGVEVTTAESDLTQARTNQVNAIYDYQTALARFARAIGAESLD